MVIRMLTISDVIEDHEEHDGVWFDDDTMEFWNSKILTDLIDDEYFITSEDNFDRTKILYSIRRYDWDSHIVETVAFQEHHTFEEALMYLEHLTGATYIGD